MSSDQLKHLQRRLEVTVSEVNNLEEQRKEVAEKIKRSKGQATKIRTEIDNLKKTQKGIIVSEHAILRYFERVLGFDLNDIRSKILPTKVEDQIKLMGNGTFPSETHNLKVKDGVVVTILEKKEK